MIWFNSLEIIDFVFIALYFIFIVFLGIKYSKVQNSENYFLAGRSMSWPVIGFSMFAASISSSTTSLRIASSECSPLVSFHRGTAIIRFPSRFFRIRSAIGEFVATNTRFARFATIASCSARKCRRVACHAGEKRASSRQSAALRPKRSTSPNTRFPAKLRFTCAAHFFVYSLGWNTDGTQIASHCVPVKSNSAGIEGSIRRRSFCE